MKTNTPCFRKSFFAAIILSAVLSSSASFSQNRQAEIDLEEQFKITSKLIVMIKADRDGAEEFGAGIIFGRESDRLLIVTAYHVVNGSSTSGIGVQFRNMPRDKYISAKLLNHDQEWKMDLAVLSVEFPKKEGIDICALPFDRLGKLADMKRGNLVYPVGNPNGVSWALPVTADKISEVTAEEITFQSAFISKGHSGGGLLDEKGNLIGMTIADAQPFGRAINLGAILQLMKKCKYPVQLDTLLSNKNTPLHAAAADGKLNKVNYLLNDCGDANSLNDFNASPLHFAAYNRRDTIISVLLKAGADPNAVADLEAGDLPLTLAIKRGCFECAKLLIDAGTKLNTQNKNGQTALHIAIDSAQQKTALLLIKSGVDVNLKDKRGETPLYYAIERKQVEVVKALLNAGAKVNINVVDYNKRKITPLIRSIDTNNLDIIESLLKAGARHDLGSISPILKAIDEKNPDIIKLLGVYGVDMNVVHSGQTDDSYHDRNLSPLEYSIRRYYNVEGAKAHVLDCIEALIRAGARLNDLGGETTSIEKNRFRPINFAIVEFFSTSNNEWADCIELLKYLIKSGAMLNLQDGDGSTALHQNLGYYLHSDYESARLKCLQFLLNAGADPNIINKKGETPLSLQYARYNNEIRKLLVQHGALDLSGDGLRVAAENGDASTLKSILEISDENINDADDSDKGATPLHYAAHNGSIEAISVLLKAGAEKDAQDAVGNTPLHWALDNEKLQAVEFLIKAGAKINIKQDDGQIAIHRAKSLASLKILIQAGAHVNVLDTYGFMPLHLAVAANDIERIKLLVKTGADVNETDRYGYTPLLNAVQMQLAEVVEILIDAGAKVNLKGTSGIFPLMLAISLQWKSGVIMLLKAGADIHMRNENGYTCLDVAIHYGYTEMASLLRSFGAKY